MKEQRSPSTSQHLEDRNAFPFEKRKETGFLVIRHTAVKKQYGMTFMHWFEQVGNKFSNRNVKNASSFLLSDRWDRCSWVEGFGVET